jgi:hypothetical protein
MAAALEQFRKILVSSEGTPIDPTTADWPEIEKGVILLLGGAFSPQEQRHLDVVFMVASALAERLRGEFGAFWFQNRSTPHGATVGFPQGILVFSPFEVVFELLGRAQLTQLGKVVEDLRAALARGGAASAKPGGLGPADYQRIFDPGLVQMFAYDPKAVSAALDATAGSTVRDFEHGFSKLTSDIPEKVRAQITREVQGALGRLSADVPVGAQIARAPQLVEFVALVVGGTMGTGIAPAEFWEQLLLPLLHVGAAEDFATPDEEELASYREGVEPLLLYVDMVPYQTPAADEDGLLGVFPGDSVKLLDPRWSGSQGVRVLQVDTAAIRDVCANFDAAEVRASVERFAAACAAAAGQPATPAPRAPGQPALLDLVLMLAQDVCTMVATIEQKGWALGLRYATESEAASEPVLQDLRRAIKEPRIVLA